MIEIKKLKTNTKQTKKTAQKTKRKKTQSPIAAL
jgi:hypothetical protein